MNSVSKVHVGRSIFIYMAECTEDGPADYSLACTLAGLGKDGIFIKNAVSDFPGFRGNYIPFDDDYRGIILAVPLNERGEREDAIIRNDGYRPRVRK